MDNTSIKTISNAIDYLYSTGGESKNIANQAHTALKQLQINLRDQTALHLLYKGDYEDLLAQPEQEPVAWWNPITNNASTDPYYRKSKECIPLYTAPQNPDVTLTDEGKTEQEPVERKTLIECIAGAISNHMTVGLYPKELLSAAEYIADNYAAPPIPNVSTKQQNVNTSEERVHKSDKSIHEMQRLGQELEQEPVAWHSHNPDYPIQDGDWVEVIFTSGQPDDAKKWTPLYTAPQKPDVTLISEGKTWQGLTDDEMLVELKNTDASTVRLPPGFKYFARAIEAKLREKNT